MKNILLLLTITIILLISCTVNETTGVIKVENRTHLGLTSVKIGDTLLAGYVAPGGYVNYYYYKEISGKLTTEGIVVDEQYSDLKVKLKPNWWVYITAKYDTDGNEVVVISAQENDSADPAINLFQEN